MALSRTYASIVVILLLVFRVEALYTVIFVNGSRIDYPTESCLRCTDVKSVSIPNTAHHAGRVYLVNDLTDCKTLGNTLIESTSTGGMLYYDISLVDGLTCYPSRVEDYVDIELSQVSSYDMCGDSMCLSYCSSTKDVHECQLTLPYTHNFGDLLRRSPLGQSAVYTYPYDDTVGLHSTNKSFVLMIFDVVKSASAPQFFTNSAVRLSAKTGTIIVFIHLLL